VTTLPRPDRALAITGTISLALAVLAAILGQLDDRVLAGVNVWLKPGKFGAAIGLYLWTMALVLPLLASPRTRGLVRAMAIASMLVELAAIFGQAARGVPSHFNIGDLLDAVIFQLMGVGIAVNVAANATAAVAFMRARIDLPAPFVWGLRLGFVVLLLGTLEGGAMLAHQAHTVGAPDGGPGLPLVGWSRVGGDLRVAHFIGMHGFQVLPLLGWLLRRRGPAGVALVAVVAVLFAAAVAWTLAGALAGRPLV
jgi:hypothetical protein